MPLASAPVRVGLMTDQISDGRGFLLFKLREDFNREGLRIEGDRGYPGLLRDPVVPKLQPRALEQGPRRDSAEGATGDC